MRTCVAPKIEKKKRGLHECSICEGDNPMTTKKLVCTMIGIGLASFAMESALAEPSAKFAVKWDAGIQNITPNGGEKAILNTKIKTSNKKELLIGVSLQTGLHTKTKLIRFRDTLLDAILSGKTATADASIEIRVLVDGEEAAPGPVVFDQRKQELSALLGEAEVCEDTGNFTDEDPSNDGQQDDVITVDEECEVTDEEIGLMLKTMAAHHFNFVMSDVASGMHEVSVMAKIVSSTGGDGVDYSDAEADALIKVGMLTVQSVHAANDPDGTDVE